MYKQTASYSWRQPMHQISSHLMWGRDGWELLLFIASVGRRESVYFTIRLLFYQKTKYSLYDIVNYNLNY